VTAGGAYRRIVYLNGWEEVIKQEDGEGNERWYGYDKAGKLTEETDGLVFQ
jgi:YD repeat-containing protein